MSRVLPLETPSVLPPERLDALDRLLEGLDGTALGFVAGYATARARLAGTAQPLASAPVNQKRLTVLYASQTGNGRRLAEKLGRLAEGGGLPVRVVNVADYPVRELAQEQLLVLFVSTHGDGDPPDDARSLLDFVASRRAPRLEKLAYAVFALGDSSYPKFCETGRYFDARFNELGARTLLARAEADGDPQNIAPRWLEDVFAKSRTEIGSDASAGARTLRLVSSPSTTATRDEPVLVEVLANHPLTGRGATREVRHLELAAPAGTLNYLPGDALGIWVHNPPKTVARLIGLLGAKGDERIVLGDRDLSLSQWLTDEREITRLTRPVLEAHAKKSGSPELLAALEPGRTDSLRPLLAQLQLVDLLAEYPATWAPEELIAALRPLSPRLYSIASSQASVGEEVHLTVAILEDERNGIERLGAASGYLAHQAPEGRRLRVYIEPNARFRLPQDSSQDIVMIGPGTGVAPFRSFVQQRAAGGDAGRSWLFFGARHFDTEFLYQAEWLDHIKRGELTRMDVAFSRDQADKVYVQHRILEQGAELWRWLDAGAAVYVCGDAEHMAPDVHVALRTVVAVHGQRSEEEAEEYLTGLAASRRYLRDVY